MISIESLSEDECKELFKELDPFDKDIQQKIEYIIKATGCSIQDSTEYVVCDSPILWAKVYINWDCRKYQNTILSQCKKRNRVVLRLGRRLGKTECICIIILWCGYTQINKDNNNQYDILIITPYETQIDLIFKRLHELIDSSELLQQIIERDVYHHIQFSNKTSIIGLTAGSKNGSGGANTRGQHANVLVLDETDYMTSNDITNIINIANDNPENTKIVSASTPCGKHEEYYKWCTGASHKFYPPKEDIEKYRFTGFKQEDVKGGNGWTEIYAPSTVNENLLKINSETGQTYIEDLKDELSEMRFLQEVMAEFGEEEMGVYQKRFIKAAIEEGRRIALKYINEMSKKELDAFLKKRRTGPRILGVDWDRKIA